jgi:hypothetical protein
MNDLRRRSPRINADKQFSTGAAGKGCRASRGPFQNPPRQDDSKEALAAGNAGTDPEPWLSRGVETAIVAWTISKRQTPSRKGLVMTMKMLALGALACSLASGAALAAGGTTSALDDPAKVGAFYTDSSMKTMKGDDDFKAAWMALTQADRDAMTKDCADSTIASSHDTFCSKAKELGGPN